MNFSVVIPPSLSNFLGCLNPTGRHNLFSVAANALKIRVRDHILGMAPARHTWADKLNGKATGHLTRGARLVTHSADADHGEVVIPIPGISRALHDVTLTPKRWNWLTIPTHGAAYGHRVAELRRMGWKVIFKPKGHDILMGKRDKKDKAITLYALKKSLTQRQDRSLLPSDADISSTISSAMIAEIMRIQRKAG